MKGCGHNGFRCDGVCVDRDRRQSDDCNVNDQTRLQRATAGTGTAAEAAAADPLVVFRSTATGRMGIRALNVVAVGRR
jgi:hypothetical protein